MMAYRVPKIDSNIADVIRFSHSEDSAERDGTFAGDSLRQVPMLRNLPQDDQLAVLRALKPRQMARGATLGPDDVSGSALLLFSTGRVVLYRLSPDGRRLVLEDLRAPTVLYCGRLGTTMAEVSEESMGWTLSRAALHELVQRHPGLVTELMSELEQRLRRGDRHQELLSLWPVHPRLAVTLYELSRQNRELHITHQELADRIGSTRETATLTLHQLAREGCIRLYHHRIEVIDRGRLLRLNSGLGNGAA
jgi:CRP-like cAMP-binding protein